MLDACTACHTLHALDRLAAPEEEGLESGGPSGRAVPDDNSGAEPAHTQQGGEGEGASVTVQMHDDSLFKYNELQNRSKTRGGETCPLETSSCAAAASCRSSSALLV